MILADRNENMNSGDREVILSIEDFDLGFAHMPLSAKKIFEKSGLSYEDVRDYKFLIINILLFLTNPRDWPPLLITCKKYRITQIPLISDLPKFIEQVFFKMNFNESRIIIIIIIIIIILY